MPNIFIFTAADSAARENFRRTVVEGVPLGEVLQYISDEAQRERLRNAFDDGLCFFWGSQEKTGGNRATWARMEEADLILGYRDRSIISAGFLVSKIDNPELARATWVGPADEPFRLIYFFKKPVLRNVPLADLQGYFGDEYRGFSAVALPKVQKLLEDYGSLEAFVQRRLASGNRSAQGSPSTAAKPRYWVEKTIVHGRPDRESGPHALGLALWSPQQSASSGDIYRLMREVRPGDRVFHLIDNDRIEGVSLVAAPADDTFVGLEGTDWAGRPSYRIQLRDFSRLSPTLQRDEFLEDAEAQSVLRDLLPSHQVFYNRGLSLRQGAYLTEAPLELVRLWNRIYRSKTGHDLPHVDVSALNGETPMAIPPREDLRAVVEDFARQLIGCGIGFGSRTGEIARTFVASLATKRFVILTGLSGSGKTQIALQLGHWLGPGRFAVVPVRPDWTGAEAVFGYEDALRDPVEGRRAWYVPYPLEFMLKAARDPNRPYLLVLDEMNLAHVERYLADLLSGMESRLATLPNLIQGDSDWRLEKGGPQKLTIPSNLFLVGTVNVDETTYMFSPKVLDRANTIDFRVETSELSADARQGAVCSEGPSDLVRGFLEIARDGEWQQTHPSPGRHEFVEKMLLLHRLLTEGGFEFGHRVLFESIRFASMLASAGEPNPEAALDYQVIQKILPRLHGSRRRLEPTLSSLGKFCLDLSFEPQTDEVRDVQRFDPLDARHRDPRLPRSFEKIRRMMRNLRANQFTSFTE